MVEMDKNSFYVTSASSRDRRSSRLSRSRPAHRQAFLQRQLSICSHEHTWLVNTWNVATEAGELNLKLCLIFNSFE